MVEMKNSEIIDSSSATYSIETGSELDNEDQDQDENNI